MASNAVESAFVWACLEGVVVQIRHPTLDPCDHDGVRIQAVGGELEKADVDAVFQLFPE